MVNWPYKCVLIAVALQCIGCAVDVVGTHSSDSRAQQEFAEAASPDDTSSGLGDAVTASDFSDRPTWASDPAIHDPEVSTYLASESEFIERGGISSEQADPLLESRELFMNAIQRMREDEEKSIEAQDLARHYRSALERAVGEHDVVEDVTCGLSLCMGSVSSRSRADRDAWAQRLYEDTDAVRHVTFDVFDRYDGRLHNRFLFSADDAIRAIALPPRRDR